MTLLPPWSRGRVESALRRLKVNELLDGYRGMPPADRDAAVSQLAAGPLEGGCTPVNVAGEPLVVKRMTASNVGHVSSRSKGVS